MGLAYDLLPATTMRKINKRDEINAAEQDGVGLLTQRTLKSTYLISVNSVKLRDYATENVYGAKNKSNYPSKQVISWELSLNFSL